MILDSVHHKVSRILAPRLLKDVGTVLIHGALGYKELVGNLLIR